MHACAVCVCMCQCLQILQSWRYRWLWTTHGSWYQTRALCESSKCPYHWALSPALIFLFSCPTVTRFLIQHMDIWLQFIIRCHLFSKHLLILNKKTLRLMISLSLWTYSSPLKTSVPALPVRLPSGRSSRNPSFQCWHLDTDVSKSAGESIKSRVNCHTAT